VPAEWRKKIIHARLLVNGVPLMGSDAPPDRYEPMRGFSVTLNFKEPAEAERVFKRWLKTAPCACRWERPSRR
jgi:PhnB protein